MSTTLEGYFFEDDDSLTSKIREALVKGRLNKPWKATVSWQDLGSQTYPKIGEVVGEPLGEGGILSVVEALKQIVIDRRGADAIGTLKVRIYEAGRANDMAVDFTRKIGVDAIATSADKVLMDRLLARAGNLEQMTTAVIEQLVAQSQVVAQVAVEQNKTIATLATQRAVTTGAADAQGIGSLISLGVLIFAWPVIREALDLPESATPAQMVKAITGVTRESWTRLQDNLQDNKAISDQNSSPPMAQAADLVTPQAADLVTPKDEANLPDPEALMEALLRAPPKYQARLKQVLKNNMAPLMELMR